MQGTLKLSFGEEVFNSITHGVMSIIMLLLLPFSAVYAYATSGITKAVGVSIFILCLFLMYISSTLYHCMSYESPHKAIFRILDHICIYLAIAGSYTPVALSLIKGWQGLLILIIQWTMVLIGILYKSISTRSMPKLSLTIYLVMGWTALIFIPSLVAKSSPLFLIFIVTGGIMYSIGAFFYAKHDLKYAHGIWHLFIVLATIFHYIAIVFFI
ncbi:MAG: hemolysin III family protein [Erysipelotrichaceae bacterium]|nr:hemolysin III family protein [Erysipelotrichaceae bacterium]